MNARTEPVIVEVVGKIEPGAVLVLRDHHVPGNWADQERFLDDLYAAIAHAVGPEATDRYVVVIVPEGQLVEVLTPEQARVLRDELLRLLPG